MPRRVVILGSTGSIGRSTLDVLARFPDRFELVGIVAGRNVEAAAEQVRRWRPRAVAMADEASAARLAQALGPGAPEIRHGSRGAAEVAVGTRAEVVVAAIVGAAGLIPTLAAAGAGITVALANKEALVVAGELMVRAARESGAALLPVDSEHSAIHQCLRAGERGEVRRIVLTASGGPFRGVAPADLARVTPEQALRHPTWRMGPKITVDSATLMNKGLEVIEAHWLFGLPGTAIDVVVHPQSVVHSMVEYRDGSLVAQLGSADMRTPIQYALTYPERWDAGGEPLPVARLGPLTFEPPDRAAFRCLDLAYAALQAGGDAPARLNAANEVAVEAFLARRLSFPGIAAVIEEVLTARPAEAVGELEDVLRADREARGVAAQAVERELSHR
ncbi:MAG: 1-deoxy-D-xylulose-5-phosphate reductoisomerase [Acidobacteria bacterium]|nr:1-deoxy-D-xylulose-5-phosphate reductoisomerase [Acidobacteriota bacterium]